MSSIFANDSFTTRNALISITLSLSLVFIDSNTTWLNPVRLGISYLTVPVETLAFLPSQVSTGLSESLQLRNHLISENNKLKEQALLQQRRVQKFAALTAENIRLRELLGSSATLSDAVLVAEIIGADPNPLSHNVVLDKGKGKGVFVGMPLIDARGLMGQVTEVGAWSSKALLITDSRHGLPVEVVRNGVRAIAVGSGSLDSLILTHVPDTTDIEAGDILVSSGLGNRFPRGYPVGVVVSVSHNPGRQFASIHVKPLAHIDRSRHVLLVYKQNAGWVGQGFGSERSESGPGSKTAEEGG